MPLTRWGYREAASGSNDGQARRDWRVAARYAGCALTVGEATRYAHTVTLAHLTSGALALAILALVATVAHGDDVVPLTDEHWRGAPATVLEHETGVPAATIDRERRDEHARDPYPSIPGGPAAPAPRRTPLR